jgi:microcompartment protein CcmL/EutN
MEAMTAGLAAIAVVASLVSLVVVLRLKREVHKLRTKNISSEKMYFDDRLGVWCSRAEDIQRYRDSIEAATPTRQPKG